MPRQRAHSRTSWRAGALSTLVGALAVFPLGCGGGVPKPALGMHPCDAFVEVPYPPPAAVAEVIPPKPRDGAVWMDGQWAWRGRYYVWQRGGWILPPPDGAYLAPWTRYYDKDGALFFADGVWRAKDGRRLMPPPKILPAAEPDARETPETVVTP
jgi:hypothetical protein